MTEYDVTLQCHHGLTFRGSPPLLGETVWCIRCQDMQDVIAAPNEYRVRCLTCSRMSRRYGAEQNLADTKARAHHDRYGHKVAVYNGRELLYVFGSCDIAIPTLEIPCENNGKTG